MKENTLDVLFYPFDNYAEVEEVTQNRDVLHGELKQAGISENRMTKALDWRESLAE